MIHCHNCLQKIKQGESYRKCSYWGGSLAASQVIYIHYPHYPEGADPDAHYQQSILEGTTEYNLVEEARYVKEGI